MRVDSRPIDRVRHHYEVEKELAQRLLASPREQRTEMFKTMYGELFDRVPDHPRIVRRDTEEECRVAVASRMSLLKGHLNGVDSFVEFAPGDCRLAFEVCKQVKRVDAIDISDQSGKGEETPENFHLIVYDGYKVDLPAGTADIGFSYQFLEHLHPDDVPLHFEMAHKLLKTGGKYIFSTPHVFSGPHDISAHFCKTPEGFHFKEWTFKEMAAVGKKAGFSKWYTYRFGKARMNGITNAVTLFAEGIIGILPRFLRWRISQRLFQGVTMVLVK
ncbi:class I SAM-dependent methyltransferase [Verrucomicrobia bacterium]|nr:class I SAM-dependent methyltransferase [Verrucomicrobiota bacterium]